MSYIGSPAAPTIATVSDDTITTAKLADDAVTSAKITDGAVTPSDLSTGHPNWDSSGNLLFNSGYGSTATAYGCRAWVQFQGSGSVTVDSSGNVSSITDNGTGNYTLNFTNSFPDVNYAVNFGVCSGAIGFNASFVGYVISSTQYGAPSNKTVSVCQIGFGDYTSTPRDFSELYVAIFR